MSQSTIAIASAYKIKTKYWQSHVFKNEGDNPFNFLLVYASDMINMISSRDKYYANNFNHKNIYSTTTLQQSHHVVKIAIIELLLEQGTRDNIIIAPVSLFYHKSASQFRQPQLH